MSYLTHFIHYLFGIATYSASELVALCMVLGIGGAVLGYITDAVMGDRGFGPTGNGCLAIVGGVVGIHYRNFILGPVASQEAILIAVTAGASATAALLILGLVKQRLVN